MAKHYKAIGPEFTVFRKSSSGRIYESGGFGKTFSGAQGGVSFSGSRQPGFWPAIEITAAEYNQLVAKRNARVRSGYGSQDSWIPNDA